MCVLILFLTEMDINGSTSRTALARVLTTALARALSLSPCVHVVAVQIYLRKQCHRGLRQPRPHADSRHPQRLRGI
uniref:Uncharacterized protein n=1 Tax=Physcomitrium patens TaxID=3218 RepID=A0A2K1JWB2_PHYPA|nr:hypothetical protein PHYPA_015588 [Physcomitrium patens]